MGKEQILIVEDDLLVLRVLRSKLEAEGYEVTPAPTSTAAMRAARAAKPDLMILDLSLIDKDSFDSIRDGFGLLEWLRLQLPDASFPVLIHTVDDSANVDLRANASGVYRVLRKGRDFGQLLLTVRQALDESEREDLVAS